MIQRVEHFFRSLRRQVSRSEWAIRVLGLPVSKGTALDPGLVLIQIDGLSRQQMERAMERGRLPFLERLLRDQHYHTRTFYPGLPASTPAVQAELFYGERCAVPAFSYFERDARRVMTMFNAECARDVEDSLQKKCETGLLRGGSSWSNIYSGGADEAETHFCAAALSLRDLMRTRPLVRVLTFPIFHFPTLLKTLGLLVVEAFIAFGDLFRGVARGENLWEEFKLVMKRVFICIGLREVMTIGAKIDGARGLPIIHLNFLGYDEQAHRRGPSSQFAHWSLKGIDRAIKNIYRAAHRSARRDYQVWVFSDHGQESAQIFDEVQGKSLEQTIAEALNQTVQSEAKRKRRDRAAHARMTGERSNPRQVNRRLQSEMLTQFSEASFTVAAFGPVGHVYFRDRLAAERRREVALRLVRNGGVPSVLLATGPNEAEWIYTSGSVRLPEELPENLPHPPAIKRELAQDLAALCHHKCGGDLVLLGWSPESPPLSFANERGAHAGPGPEETQGFVLIPELTRLPDHVTEYLRPVDLRAAVRHYLGLERISLRRTRPRPSVRELRVMTYNVHSCLGMDGRTSPRRIANVISRYNPDLVALQELDLGRVRSQRHDQPKLIAEELGMHVAFCPTVVAGGEQYGHALLSHFPLKIIRTDILRSGKQSPRVQPRGALWVQVEIDGMKLNLMNTHFGLRRSERREQAADLLDRNWIGSISEDEPLILCGDFNMFPRSQPYRALTRRLRDVQGDTLEVAPMNTFSTLRPMVRIDHIFVSRHFHPKNVRVPRNHLTRVASDHLPLIVDLTFQAEENVNAESLAAA